MTVVRTSVQSDTLYLIGHLRDGSRIILPAWMADAAAKAIVPVDYPRLPFACLLEVRRLLPAAITSDPSITRRDSENGTTSHGAAGIVYDRPGDGQSDTESRGAGGTTDGGRPASRGGTKSVDRRSKSGGQR
jgi:hypothetical protein